MQTHIHETFRLWHCGRQCIYKTTGVWCRHSSVTAASMAGYHDLNEFEHGVIVGAQDMGYRIFKFAMHWDFSHTTIS